MQMPKIFKATIRKGPESISKVNIIT